MLKDLKLFPKLYKLGASDQLYVRKERPASYKDIFIMAYRVFPGVYRVIPSTRRIDFPRRFRRVR